MGDSSKLLEQTLLADDNDTARSDQTLCDLAFDQITGEDADIVFLLYADHENARLELDSQWLGLLSSEKTEDSTADVDLDSVFSAFSVTPAAGITDESDDDLANAMLDIMVTLTSDPDDYTIHPRGLKLDDE